MYAFHQAFGGETELTVYEDLGHTVWDQVYSGDMLYRWFLSKMRAKAN